jgi:hypothetical protein
MIKQLFILFSCMMVCTYSLAQTESFDILSFTPPKGWKRDVAKDVISFTDMNQKRGSYCIIGIYSSHKSSGSAEKDFASEWNARAVKPFGAQAAPPTEKQKPGKGWEVIAGVSPIIIENTNALVMLTVMTGHGRGTGIIVNMNDTGYQKTVTDFLNSININKDIKTANASDETKKEDNTPVKKINFIKGTLYGGSNVKRTGDIEMTYIYLYEDGLLYRGMNEKGFYGADFTEKKKRSPYFFETCIITGNKIKATMKNELYYEEYFIDKSGSLTCTHGCYSRYDKLPACTNFYFEGTYYRKHMVATAPEWNEKYISFTDDGRFTDNNGFAIVQISDYTLPYDEIKSEYERRIKSGSGKYHIEYNTLFLDYDDGRKNTLCFYVLPEQLPKKTPDVININNYNLELKK